MKLSLCVPIYGTEKYIERCARSLFEQGNEDVEYIFVNDCTKDNSVNVLKKTIEEYPSLVSKIKIIELEKNLGLAGARLAGLQNASGDYIWCVDSDDYIEPNAVSSLLPYMNGGNDFIVFNYKILNREGITCYKSTTLNVDNVLSNRVSPCIWKCVFKKELCQKYNIWPVVGINNSEDYLLTSRLIFVAKSPILIDDYYLYNYNLMNENSYTNKPSLKNLQDCVKCMLVVFDFYKKYDAIKAHHVALGYRMAICYRNLFAFSSSDVLCMKLLMKIKEVDKLLYFLLRHNVYGLSQFLKLYRKMFL